MSAPISEEVKIRLTGDETHSLSSHEVDDAGNAASGSSAPFTLEKVARQIKAATDPFTKELEELSDLMSELRRDTSRRSEEIYGLDQGPLRPRGDESDTI